MKSQSRILDRRLFVPYRICLLGEHVDHQGGESLAASIDVGIHIAFSPSADEALVVEAADLDAACESRIDEPFSRHGDWTDYLRGVVHVLRERVAIRRGIRACVHADFPGGGVSSSAAVQIAYALALLEANEVRLTRRDVAEVVIQAERECVGVQVGWLDPLAILETPIGGLLHIDFTSLTATPMPCVASATPLRIALVHGGRVRRLADSPYNRRVEECARAAGLLSEGAQKLADAVPIDETRVDALPAPLDRRVRHFIGELRRVRNGVEAWQRGDALSLARAINDCGDSCTDLFDVGAPETCRLVDSLRATPGVIAARYTGGGFGGAVIAALAADDPAARIAVKKALDVHVEQFGGRASLAFPRLGCPPKSVAMDDS